MEAAKLAELRAQNALVIGLGAIGSWVARWLSANGIPFVGYDPDVVSLKNISAGAFSQDHVGSYKAVAIGGSCARERWNDEYSLGPLSSVLVCADHGETRRTAAVKAYNCSKPFYCAKANGSLFQVWKVDSEASLADFKAFDEAAEANPVQVPCGDSSVGRVASLGAAAQLLSEWSGVEISPDEVEASYGVRFDPAIAHVIQARWTERRDDSELAAHEAAHVAFEKFIDDERTSSDSRALRELQVLRDTRAENKRKRLSTIHTHAICLLDEGYEPIYAARKAVRSRRSLEGQVRAEEKLRAHAINSELSLPDTIQVEELAS